MRVTTKRSGIASALVFRVQVRVTPFLRCHVPACATVSPQLSPLRIVRSECNEILEPQKESFPVGAFTWLHLLTLSEIPIGTCLLTHLLAAT